MPVWRAVNVLFLLFKSNIFDAWIIYKMTPDFWAAHFIQEIGLWYRYLCYIPGDFPLNNKKQHDI